MLITAAQLPVEIADDGCPGTARLFQLCQLLPALPFQTGELSLLLLDCKAVASKALQTGLYRAQQLATLAGEITQPCQMPAKLPRILLVKRHPEQFIAAADVRQTQLCRQIIALTFKLHAGLLKLAIEIGELSVGDGQLAPRTGQLAAQAAGLVFCRTQLFIQILAFRLIATSLCFKAADLLAYLSQILLGLAGITRSRNRLHQEQQKAESCAAQQAVHWAGSVGDDVCIDDGLDIRGGLAHRGHGYNAAPARSGNMDRLLEFIAANPLLVAATVLMAVAVVVIEIQLRARALLEISTAEAVRMINRGAAVVDIRDKARFDAGHIVDAVHMTAEDLAKGEQGRIKKKRGLVVICESGSRSYSAVKALRTAGFDGAFGLKGGMGSWQRDSQPLVTGQR